jgi:predicted nucleic acid-binding protein
MAKIDTALARMAGRRVYIDTNIFIYFLDRTPGFADAASAIVVACADRQFFGVTGDAAVAEVMAGAYKADDPALAERFKQFFHRKNFLSITGHNSEVFDAAAKLVARKRLKFIDALHVATALTAGCPFFMTNDVGIKSSDSLEVVQLGELID